MRLLLASYLVIALGFHAQAQTLQLALTPAGTPIRNQASASFIGPNGEPGVTFSGVAQTLVSTVRGMQIKPDANNAPVEEAVEPKKESPESIKQGATKLAEVWDEMPADKLSKVTAKWKPDELAIVLNEMDPAKVAE